MTRPVLCQTNKCTKYLLAHMFLLTPTCFSHLSIIIIIIIIRVLFVCQSYSQLDVFLGSQLFYFIKMSCFLLTVCDFPINIKLSRTIPKAKSL